MCGTFLVKQVGDNTCKMPISPHSSLIKKQISSQYSMDTEVYFRLFRCLSCNFCESSLRAWIGSKQKLPQKKLWSSTEIDVLKDGLDACHSIRKKLTFENTEIDEREVKRAEILGGVKCGMYC